MTSRASCVIISAGGYHLTIQSETVGLFAVTHSLDIFYKKCK